MRFNYYKITNVINNKFYIGITEKKTEKRIQQHFRELQKGTHINYKMQADYDLYGEENFKWETLETLDFDSPEEGYNHEYELIQKTDAINIGYNILKGGLLNPMYTDSVKEKMIKTKQSQVSNVYQLEEIEENVFKIIRIFPSQKNIQKITGLSQANINKAIKKHSKNYGYFWVLEEDIQDFEKSWKPYRIKISPTAQLDEFGNIVEVHHNTADFCREYGWDRDLINHAIRRNGKAKGIKFIYIPEEEYYKIKPITLIK